MADAGTGKEPDPVWATPIYKLHQWASTKAWKESKARAKTEKLGIRSVYDPNLSPDEICEIEMGCARRTHGTIVKDRPVQRVYYYDTGRRIGASNGEFTSYVLVYHDRRTGNVHGYPITTDALLTTWKVKV